MWVLSAILILCTSTVSISSNNFEYTLSGNSKPINYDLWITIDIDRLTFNGTVDITVEVVNPTNAIELNIEVPAFVTFNHLLDGPRSIPLGVTISKAPEIRFNFTEELTANTQYVLSLGFSGAINDDLKGLYRSHYFDSTGNMRSIATTFFAATYARMVFPCYDEPHYKATFNIHITHDAKYMALSNMGQIGDPPGPDDEGFFESSFEQTPLMSTYLVAFIVSDFEKTKSDSTFNIYSQVAQLENTVYAADYGKKVLAALETYTDSSYQLPKMDLVAIDDFLMGAMENWGLITFKSSRVFYSDDSTTKDLQSVSEIVSHELVHQWFGNQVTCYWWSAIWLNEGFATYYADYISGIIDPSWRHMDQFLVNVVHKVMMQDDYEDVRAMNSEVVTHAQTNTIYDFVAYQKAASVIRMIQNIVTENTFHKSIKSYLKERKFNVATPNDLYTHIQEGLDIDRPTDGNSLTNIKEIFDSWTTTSGYPVINVERNYLSGVVTVSQKRYTRNRADRREKYYVPLNFAMKNTSEFLDTRATHWLKPIDANIEIFYNSPDDWIIFNKQQTSYYRVNYDERNWRLISNELNGTNFNIIHPSNRAQLIDDVYNFGVFGYLHLNFTLDIVKYVKQETDLIPMIAALKVLNRLSMKLRHEKNEQIQQFFLESIEANYKKYSLLNYSPTTETHVDNLLRMDVVQFACFFGLESCLNEAKSIFNANISRRPADLRSAIYCGAMRAKNPSDIYAKYINHLTVLLSSSVIRRDNLVEIHDIIAGLGCSSDSSILESTLKLSVVDGTINFKPEDRNKMFEAVVKGSVLGTSMALDFLNGTFPEMQKKYQSIASVFAVFEGYIGSNPLRNKYVDVGRFHSPSLGFEEVKTLNLVGNAAIRDIEWSATNSITVENWLESYYGGSGSLFQSSLALIVGVFVLIKVIV